MSISRTVVNRPTTVLIIFALVIGIGLYTATNVAIDLFPEISPPILVVTTSYDGAGPQEVETTVTRLVEGQLSNVSNVDAINSTSSEGTSQVTISFTYGTNITEAANEVRDRLEFVKSALPEEASTPQIFKFDPGQIPILELQLSGDRSAEDLRQIADESVRSSIEKIDGVALANVSGGRERAIRIEVPQDRLEAYGLNMTQLSGLIRGSNVAVSAGNVEEGSLRYLVRTSGEYASLNEIRNTVIAYRGSPASPANPDGGLVGIRVQDIGEVSEGFEERSDAVYINGSPGVFISVQKQSGTNSVQVADRVVEELEEINRRLPRGVELSVLTDTTQIIEDSLQQVGSSAVLGAVLAVVILFVFLRSFRSTLIIATAIPASLIVTLMFMYFLGLTLNLMTLAGLALGVGMLVDNSIVILENIYRYREKGAKLHASAILGSEEMTNAISASTLTTVSVFLPVAVFQNQLELVGELFADLAITVVVSLLSSLAVAAALVPALSSRWIPITVKKKNDGGGILGRVDRALGKAFTALDNAYKRALAAVLTRKAFTIGIVAVALIATLAIVPTMPFVFAPTQAADTVVLTVDLPVGTRLENTESVLLELADFTEQAIASRESVLVSAGTGQTFGFGGATSTNSGSLTISLPPFEDRTQSPEEIEALLRTQFDRYPGVEFGFQEQIGLGTGAPLQINIVTDDLDAAAEVGAGIVELLERRFPESVTDPSLNLSDGSPVLSVVVDRDRAASLGLTVSSIGQELRANLDGIAAGRYRTGGNELDILLVLDDESRNTIPDIQKVFVNNVSGQMIPLSSFATIDRSTGPVQINRENQTRILTVSAGVNGSVTQITPAVERAINEEIVIRDGMRIEFSGEFEDLQRYGSTFVGILIVAVALVFGVMASQFESLVDPFIILFTIPLTLIGVVWLFLLTGEALSLFTAVGLVVLVGIVVNNGIVLVDYTNLLRKRGMPLIDACVEAGGNRLRPILMTTLTTVLGLVPVAFVEGQGSSLIQPIAKTVVGGLSVATIFTLFVIPVVYSVVNRRSEAREERRRAIGAGVSTVAMEGSAGD